MFRTTTKLTPLSFQHTNTSLQHLTGVYKISTRYYQSQSSSTGKRSFLKYVVLTAGGSIAISGGAIAYAKYDPKFRKILEEKVPGSNAFIKFLYQEDKSYLDSVKGSISNTSENVVNSVYKLVGKNDKNETPKEQVSIPPSLLKITKPSSESRETEKKAETTVKPVSRIEKSQKEVTEPKKSETDQPPPVRKSDDYEKYNIAELEKKAVKAAKEATLAYTAAINELKDYREEVTNLIEKSVSKDDYNIWFKIREKTELKDAVIEGAEDKSEIAMKKIEHLKLLINDPKIQFDPQIKTSIEYSIKNVLSDLIYTKALFSQERDNSSITDKFTKKVEESRSQLSKQLGVLFPSLLVDSEFVVTEEELDLFVLYTCQLLNFYQKELQKLETIGEARINQIIEESKSGSPNLIKDVVDLETEKLKREFAQELMKQELKLKMNFEKELINNLRRQTEVHADHIEEIVSLKDRETNRKIEQSIAEKVDDTKINYNRQLAKIIGRMKGLDAGLKEKMVAEKQAKHSQRLWSACQSLILTIQSGTNTKPWEEQLKPLENEVSSISEAAAEEDALVSAVVASIPSAARSRGVFSELALRDRFLRVEKLAYRLANLPEGTASIPAIFLSYLQSFLLIKPSSPIPPAELANEPFDPSSLNNYDVLYRARYWLDRGDFQQTLRYMNLLKGAARVIATEWMNEMRIYLETKQAANLLLAHAVYSSYVYSQTSS